MDTKMDMEMKKEIDNTFYWRREKENHDLQKLPAGYFDNAKVEIGMLRKDPASNLDEIMKEHYSLNALSDLRIKKVIKGAIADAYRDKPVHAVDPFTTQERILYETIVKGIQNVKNGG